MEKTVRLSYQQVTPRIASAIVHSNNFFGVRACVRVYVCAYFTCEMRTSCVFFTCEDQTSDKERMRTGSQLLVLACFGLVILENDGIDPRMIGVACVRSSHVKNMHEVLRSLHVRYSEKLTYSTNERLIRFFLHSVPGRADLRQLNRVSCSFVEYTACVAAHCSGTLLLPSRCRYSTVATG